jgi:hypothetical protein
MAYGIVSRLAHAMPKAVIDTSNMFGLLKAYIDISPKPPMSRQTTCVATRPVLRASTGSRNAAIAATPLYHPIRTPVQLAPVL